MLSYSATLLKATVIQTVLKRSHLGIDFFFYCIFPKDDFHIGPLWLKGEIICMEINLYWWLLRREKQPMAMADLILINVMDDALNNLSAVFVMLLRSLTLGFQEPQAHFFWVCALQLNFSWSIRTRSKVYTPVACHDYGVINP